MLADFWPFGRASCYRYVQQSPNGHFDHVHSISQSLAPMLFQANAMHHALATTAAAVAEGRILASFPLPAASTNASLALVRTETEHSRPERNETSWWLCFATRGSFPHFSAAQTGGYCVSDPNHGTWLSEDCGGTCSASSSSARPTSSLPWSSSSSPRPSPTPTQPCRIAQSG